LFKPVEPVFDGLLSEDPFINEILHFADCCHNSKTPLTSGRDNINTLKTVFGIYESVRRGCRVELDSL